MPLHFRSVVSIPLHCWFHFINFYLQVTDFCIFPSQLVLETWRGSTESNMALANLERQISVEIERLQVKHLLRKCHTVPIPHHDQPKVSNCTWSLLSTSRILHALQPVHADNDEVKLPETVICNRLRKWIIHSFSSSQTRELRAQNTWASTWVPPLVSILSPSELQALSKFLLQNCWPYPQGQSLSSSHLSRKSAMINVKWIEIILIFMSHAFHGRAFIVDNKSRGILNIERILDRFSKWVLLLIGKWVHGQFMYTAKRRLTKL